MMAQKTAGALRMVTVLACNRLLAKGRNVIPKSEGVDRLGSDALDTWKHMYDQFDFGQVQIPESFEFHLRYDDAVDPNKQPTRIVLTSHGSPGSHEDFKYMTPKLVDGGDGFRVLGFNWPEHGHSEVTDETEYFYSHSSDERSEILEAFLSKLGVKKLDVLVGHSFGCYPLFAFGTDQASRKLSDALLLVNCGGPTPHKSIRPYSVLQVLARLSYHEWFGGTTRRLFFLMSKYLIGLKVKDVELTASNLMVIAHLGFEELPQRLEILRTDPQTPRVLYVYSEDDFLIEPASSESLVRALGCPNPIAGYEDGALNKVENWWKNWNAKTPGSGSKNFAVNFGKGRGGHFLQKHQADFLASCVRIMSEK